MKKIVKKKAAPKKKAAKKVKAIEWITRAEFARRTDNSKQYIGQLCKKGALTVVKNKLDYQKSLEDLKGYLDQAFTDSGKENSGSFAQSRAKNEHFKALTAELEFNQKNGELLDRKKIEEQQFQAGRACRNAFQSIAGRLSAQIAGMDDAKQIEKLIDGEINAALLELTA